MEDGVEVLQIWNTATSSWQDLSSVKGIYTRKTSILSAIIKMHFRSVCRKLLKYDIQVDARDL